MIVADYSAAQPAQKDATPFEIPSGKTAILVLDDVYPSRAEIPESVTHRITARFGRPESGEGGIAVLWPTEVTQTGGLDPANDASFPNPHPDPARRSFQWRRTSSTSSGGLGRSWVERGGIGWVPKRVQR